MAIEVNIKKNFGTFQLDIAFESASRRIGILGASGCGKSLTLKSIAGILHPDEGKIIVDGRVLFDSQSGIFMKPQIRKIGYLFQNYALFPTMTVEENIAAGLKGKKEEKAKIVCHMIEKYHLSGLEKRLPGQLSGGQQQRVALARIMAYEPEVILLDEPFSALDVYLRDQMQRELMKMMQDYPGIIILVSHNRDEVYRMSEELLILDNGKIAVQGETKKVFENPGSAAAARITGCKNIVDVTWGEGTELYIRDWDLRFSLKKVPDNDVTAIAVRAHEFSIQKNAENGHLCFPVLDPVITEDLFEYNISFKTSKDAVRRVDWKVSKYSWKYGENEFPDKLYLKEKDLLFLREDLSDIS